MHLRDQERLTRDQTSSRQLSERRRHDKNMKDLHRMLAEEPDPERNRRGVQAARAAYRKALSR